MTHDIEMGKTSSLKDRENLSSCQSIILELKEWKTKLIETWLPLNGTQEGVDWFKERLVELEILIATYGLVQRETCGT